MDTAAKRASAIGCGLPFLAVPYLDGVAELNAADAGHLLGLYRFDWWAIPPGGFINPSLLTSRMRGVRRSRMSYRVWSK